MAWKFRLPQAAAEEVAAETIEALWENSKKRLHAFDPTRGSFLHFLMKIAKRRYLDKLRQEKCRPKVPLGRNDKATASPLLPGQVEAIAKSVGETLGPKSRATLHGCLAPDTSGTTAAGPSEPSGSPRDAKRRRKTAQRRRERVLLDFAHAVAGTSDHYWECIA